MLQHVRFVLSHPQHAGNIGACARALKTMGLSDLRLVSPRDYASEEAVTRACGGVDVLQSAIIHDELSEAIADCELVIGTSARARFLDYEILNPREMCERIAAEAPEKKVAILFGRESNGLANEEIECCHFHVMVPANPEYSSLNIASAVQILAYELRMASLSNVKKQEILPELATAEQLDQFFEHMERVLKEIDFLKPTASTQLMGKLKRLYIRSRVTPMEMNILRGILRATELSARSGNSGELDV